MDATAAPQAGAVARARGSLPSGWWGMALLIATEATLFGSLIATYFYLRFNATEWPPDGIPAPSVTLPLVLTAMLLTTATPMAGAVIAGRRGRRGAAWALVAVATVMQATYLGLQIHLYVQDMHDFRPESGAYASIYFLLLGVHHAHVAVGLALNAWLLGKLATGLTNYRLIGLRTIALYWYFVLAVAVLVTFTTLYPAW
jgi:cytochrome c oxidase subunit 3/cytochrome c oxidase subunit I+III